MAQAQQEVENARCPCGVGVSEIGVTGDEQAAVDGECLGVNDIRYLLGLDAEAVVAGHLGQIEEVVPTPGEPAAGTHRKGPSVGGGHRALDRYVREPLLTGN